MKLSNGANEKFASAASPLICILQTKNVVKEKGPFNSWTVSLFDAKAWPIMHGVWG